MIPFLTKKFHVLRYNGRGQGEGPFPQGPYHLDQQVEDLKLLLDLHQLEKVSFIGLSHGARIALKYCELYPDTVERAALSCFFDNPSSIAEAKLRSWLKAYEGGGAKLRFDIALPWIWSRELLDQKPELVEEYRNRADSYPSHVSEALITGALSGTINPQHIRTPLLFLAAQEDVLTPVWEMREMAQRYEKLIYKEVRGAHSCLLERPNLALEHLIPFLCGEVE